MGKTYLPILCTTGNRRRDAHDFCGNLTTDYTQSLGLGARPFIYTGLGVYPSYRSPSGPPISSCSASTFTTRTYVRSRIIGFTSAWYRIPYPYCQSNIQRELCVFRYSVEILRGSVEVSNIIIL
jgi:hypothetical protein